MMRMMVVLAMPVITWMSRPVNPAATAARTALSRPASARAQAASALYAALRPALVLAPSASDAAAASRSAGDTLDPM